MTYVFHCVADLKTFIPRKSRAWNVAAEAFKQGAAWVKIYEFKQKTNGERVVTIEFPVENK